MEESNRAGCSPLYLLRSLNRIKHYFHDKICALNQKDQIIEHEKKLLDAFANKDLAAIDELIHNDALFIYPNGQSVTKINVLDNYRSGNSAFSEINVSDQQINLINDNAVVIMTLELKGNYYDQQISALFKYIRVWKLTNGSWRVIAVSGVPINAN